MKEIQLLPFLGESGKELDIFAYFPGEICVNTNQYRELHLVQVLVNAHVLLMEGR